MFGTFTDRGREEYVVEEIPTRAEGCHGVPNEAAFVKMSMYLR